MKLMDHAVILCLIFWGTIHLVSRAATPFYISTNSIKRFQFLCLCLHLLFAACLFVFKNSHRNGYIRVFSFTDYIFHFQSFHVLQTSILFNNTKYDSECCSSLFEVFVYHFQLSFLLLISLMVCVSSLFLNYYYEFPISLYIYLWKFFELSIESKFRQKGFVFTFITTQKTLIGWDYFKFNSGLRLLRFISSINLYQNLCGEQTEIMNSQERLLPLQ